MFRKCYNFISIKNENLCVLAVKYDKSWKERDGKLILIQFFTRSREINDFLKLEVEEKKVLQMV